MLRAGGQVRLPCRIARAGADDRFWQKVNAVRQFYFHDEELKRCDPVLDAGVVARKVPGCSGGMRGCDMIDFEKLRDPAWQEECRKKREAEEAAATAKERQLRAAVRVCLDSVDSLSDKERSLVNSVNGRLNSFLLVSEKQEKWFLDIASRFSPEVVSQSPAASVSATPPKFRGFGL